MVRESPSWRQRRIVSKRPAARRGMTAGLPAWCLGNRKAPIFCIAAATGTQSPEGADRPGMTSTAPSDAPIPRAASAIELYPSDVEGLVRTKFLEEKDRDDPVMLQAVVLGLVYDVSDGHLVRRRRSP
jgi:hypothetical protein